MAEWSTFCSSSDAFFTRVYQLLNSPNGAHERILAKFMQAPQSPRSPQSNGPRPQKIDMINDHFQYFGTVDSRTGTTTFQRSKQEVDRFRNGKLPKFLFPVQTKMVRDTSWSARATMIYDSYDVCILGIQNDCFRLIQPNFAQHYYLLYWTNELSSMSPSTDTTVNFLVGQLSVTITPNFTHVQATLHESVPSNLPVLLFFTVHNLLLGCKGQTPKIDFGMMV